MSAPSHAAKYDEHKTWSAAGRRKALAANQAKSLDAECRFCGDTRRHHKRNGLHAFDVTRCPGFSG